MRSVALSACQLLVAALPAAIPLLPRDALADPPPAPVSAPGPRDTIYLKNGGILRGTIVDAIPDDHARIELVTHEIQTVQWGEILRIEQGELPAPPPRQSTPAAPTPGSTQPASQPLVWVHIEGAEGARLEQDPTGNDDWATACSAACDKQLSTESSYRIAGAGLRTSSRFSLHGPPGGRETLLVSSASTGWFIAGVVSAPVGGLVAYIGLFAGVFGSLGYTSSDASGTHTHPPSPSLAATGWTMVAVGGAVGVGGLVLLLSNFRTGVRQQLGAEPAARLGGREAIAAPVWREATSMDAAVPAALTVPLLTGMF